MDIILLERIAKLGQMGDVVTVKDGYARNYLLPKGKALRANKANLAKFEEQRAQLEARNLEMKAEAEVIGEKLAGNSFIVIRQAGDSGQLYGSVNTRDIAALVTEGGFSTSRNQVELTRPIKTLGLHDVNITLHSEVVIGIIINVARSEEEAERQARGEDVTIEQEDEEEIVIGEEEIFENPEEAEGMDSDEPSDEDSASQDEK
jgi:large subunit ribosomal protein L9